MAIFTSRDREATLARLLELGEADGRLDAAVLTGSLGAATADQWSDIDLDFLVKDDASCEHTAADWVELCYAEFPRRAITRHVGSDPRLVGRAGFGRHDVLHACVAANRGRLWQSLFYLQRVRNRALASERHGLDAEEFQHVDDLPPPEREPFLGSLVARLDQASLLDAIGSATRGFLEELARGDPSLAARLRAPLLAFVAASRQPPSAGESELPDGAVTAVT
jgi:hypothetical protein